MGKTVIVIDLNPLSRSARLATVTIVDELSRALEIMLDATEDLTKLAIDADYDHRDVLDAGLQEMLNGLKKD